MGIADVSAKGDSCRTPKQFGFNLKTHGASFLRNARRSAHAHVKRFFGKVRRGKMEGILSNIIAGTRDRSAPLDWTRGISIRVNARRVAGGVSSRNRSGDSGRTNGENRRDALPRPSFFEESRFAEGRRDWSYIAAHPQEIRGGFASQRRRAHYLTLGLSAELVWLRSSRIRLATQIGSRLVGVLYILDEPSIGLHQRDNARLLNTLRQLRDLGNTVIVVEHDEETMREADHLIDLGPGAGKHGGLVIAEGTFDAVSRNPASITGRYLRGELSIPIPSERRPMNEDKVFASSDAAHNLDLVSRFCSDCSFAGHRVSGSGSQHSSRHSP